MCLFNSPKQMQFELPKKLVDQLKRKLKEKPSNEELSGSEDQLIERINIKTNQLNKNNITRTQAYLNYYQRNREIDWSFLAHMVSRNGGYNMTDLKGEFLPKLLDKKEQKQFFMLLERANWLIFQDAYPQLLLYEESKKRQIPLFNLFPHLHVSSFMEVLWRYFWQSKNSELLTNGLIINEQNYIETRVIQNTTFKQTVLNSLEYSLQDILRLNHILFPYKPTSSNLDPPRLIGETVQHFSSLEKRILFGKKIYSLLFNKAWQKKVQTWAQNTPHTGSRHDFWPQLFSTVKQSTPGKLFSPKITNCYNYDATRLYSPKLNNAWKEVKHEKTNYFDWFSNIQQVKQLEKSPIQTNGEIEQEYCNTLAKISFIVDSKEAIFEKIF